MRRLLCHLVPLALATAATATDYRKLSPYVARIAAEASCAPRATRTDGQPRHGAPAGRHGVPTVTAFVSTAPGATPPWADYGCTPHARLGSIAIVSIPADRIGPLASHPAIRRIEASPTGTTHTDTTAVITGADRLRRPSALVPQAYTAKGVVVGVMDIGFDLTHPNFYDATATRYRVGAFWDQLSTDTVGSPLPVGRDYTGADAVRARRRSEDGLLQTHGTHTLGIAAGTGYGSPYRGLAPDADLCLVSNAVSEDIALIDSADIYKYTTATDALGFKYIFDYADRQGKPCVVSFSEGYPPYLDSEDSLYSAFLDSLCGPGHIIVASAGNECVASTYMEKPRGADVAGAFLKPAATSALYRLRCSGPLALNLLSYGTGTGSPDATLRFHSAYFGTGDTVADTLLTAGGDTCAVVLDRHASAFTPDTVYTLHITAGKPLDALPPLALVVGGRQSLVSVYGSSASPLGTDAADSRWTAAEATHNIHAPACFPAVVAVGATAHRLGFTNYEGHYRDFSEGRTPGQRSPYSSVGPAMNGLTKPDVVAPGDNIVSSYSSFYLEQHPDAADIKSDVSHFDFQGRTYAWNANTGTSMAAPVVAGVIALWLQAKPTLTPQEVVDVLSHTCRQPDSTLPYPNTQVGYGEIDAYRGLLHILGADAAISRRQLAGAAVTVHGRTLSVSGVARSSALSVYSLGGHRLLHTTLAPTAGATATVDLGTLPAGVYAVQLAADAGHTAASTLIRLP